MALPFGMAMGKKGNQAAEGMKEASGSREESIRAPWKQSPRN